jgi:SUKH superfamily protein
MMSDTIKSLVARIATLADGDAELTVEWYGPASDSDIEAVEQALGLRVPPSLREFLRQTGGGGLDGLPISGIVSGEPLTPNQQTLHGDTTEYRRVYGLPQHLLIVQRDADDNEPFCLDTSDPAVESPVVLFYMNTGHTEPIADDFVAFYERYLQPYFDDAAAG